MSTDKNENLRYERTPVSQRAKNPDPDRFTEYRYDERDLLEWRIVSPQLKAPLSPMSMHYERDKDGSIIRTNDSNGIVVEHVVDGWGRLVERQDAYGNSHLTGYDVLGQATRHAIVGQIAPSQQVELLAEGFAYRNEAGWEAATVRKIFFWDDKGQRHDAGRSVVKLGVQRRRR